MTQKPTLAQRYNLRKKPQANDQAIHTTRSTQLRPTS